ncbi:MAG TPA: lysine--tRNA ligase, partial [Tepidisphaeraceae bacterium]|nr:lysine--tRNA ligase [Tepidisphaeraceae bacterium]
MSSQGHWIDRVAAQVEEHVRRNKGEGASVVCASGISPSGSIHLGNLRELMTVHLVCEELRSRGLTVEHIHSWDDFDRFRKVPVGVPDAFAAHIGKPICDIPDPGDEYDSYASRHIAEFQKSMEQLGIRPRYIRQSQEYRAGKYNEQIKVAMNKRLKIFDILNKYQTLEREGAEPVEARREAYYPLRVYCAKCGTDSTKITGWDDAANLVSYACAKCGHAESFKLEGPINAKLVWKVDWPMRWVFEGVDFEPGGEDHAAPGSSYTVGKQIAPEIFSGKAPSFTEYSFVGMAGRTKISSSAGTNATPQVALDILEPCILRWLYIRRQVKQKFDIDFGQQVVRLYDEWDAYCKNVESGKANDADKRAFERAVSSSQGNVGRTELAASFRLLSSVTDITEGNLEQMLNIVMDQVPGAPTDHGVLKEELEPRLGCAMRWSQQYVPEDERTHVQKAFDPGVYAGLSEQNKKGIAILLEKLEGNWSMDGISHLVYGVPKILLGLPMD